MTKSKSEGSHGRTKQAGDRGPHGNTCAVQVMVPVLCGRKGCQRSASKGNGRTRTGPSNINRLRIYGLGQHEDDGSQNPILVMEDDTTKVITAHMVPRKGPDDYSVNRLAQDIRGLGYTHVIPKSDQEPAILALNDSVKATVGTEIVPEESPVGESQSNGRVEKGSQDG